MDKWYRSFEFGIFALVVLLIILKFSSLAVEAYLGDAAALITKISLAGLFIVGWIFYLMKAPH